MLKIELPNVPIPWAAPKRSKDRYYDIRALDKILTRKQLYRIYKGMPIQGYVVLDFIFYFPVPKSASKKNKELMLRGEIIPTSCDATNLQKLYEDCIKNLIITDDRNVVKISSMKLYAEKETIIMKIWTWQEFRESHEINYR